MSSAALFFNAQKESNLAQPFGDRRGYWPPLRAYRSVQGASLCSQVRYTNENLERQVRWQDVAQQATPIVLPQESCSLA